MCVLLIGTVNGDPSTPEEVKGRGGACEAGGPRACFPTSRGLQLPEQFMGLEDRWLVLVHRVEGSENASVGQICAGEEGTLFGVLLYGRKIASCMSCRASTVRLADHREVACSSHAGGALYSSLAQLARALGCYPFAFCSRAEGHCSADLAGIGPLR